jgi:DNA repair protein RecO (recombination protein O)
MQAFCSDALVLRTYRYGEADCIVVFLTSDRGKKRGVAKNALKSRRRFGAALEPLTQGKVAYVEREQRELVRVDRIEPVESPLGAAVGSRGADADQLLGHAAYFAELLDEWAQDGETNERLFRLGTAVGRALGRGGSIAALARYFEYWLLRLEGVYPALDACARCGREVLVEGAALSDRHYVCLQCAPGGPRLSAAAVAFLHQARTSAPADAAETTVSSGALREIEHVHDRLIAMHLEREPRSTRIVKELRPHL